MRLRFAIRDVLWLTARFVLLALLTKAGDCKAQDSLKTVESDWQHRFKYATSIEYVLDGTVHHSRGHVTKNASVDDGFPPGVSGPIPSGSYQFAAKRTLVLDLGNRRCRKEYSGQTYYVSRARYIPEWYVELFDGHEFQTFTPRQKNTGHGFTPADHQPDLYNYGKTTLRRVFDYLDWPVLMAHGLIPTSSTDPKQLLFVRPNMSSLSVAGTGSTEAGECLILRATSSSNPAYQFEYWVDLSAKSAVRRVIWMHGAKEISRLEIDYSKDDAEYWPSKWKWIGINSEENSSDWEEYAVKTRTFDAALSDDTFKINPLPGMVVRDPRR